jgi:hypothetical protein
MEIPDSYDQCDVNQALSDVMQHTYKFSEQVNLLVNVKGVLCNRPRHSNYYNKENFKRYTFSGQRVVYLRRQIQKVNVPIIQIRSG